MTETILTVVIIVAMFLLPALIVWMTKKIKFLGTIGAVALCYAVGFVFAALPLPYDRSLTQTVASVMVAVAIPLILFSINLGSVKSLAKKTIVSFLLVIVAAVVASAAAFFVANSLGLENAEVLSGMATGLYIGGTPNLYFVGSAMLSGDDATSVITAANTSDFLVGGVYFLLLLTVIPRVYQRLLDGKKRQDADSAAQSGTEPAATAEPAAVSDEISGFAEEYNYKAIPHDKASLWRLVGVVALAVGCLAVGAGINLLLTGGLDQTMYLLIAVSVLGVAFSFAKPIRNTKGIYQVGQYLILVFSLGLSMSIDFSVLVRELLPTLAFFACTQVACVLLHLLLCKIFKIDSGTAIITSTAGIYGPPFVAPVANAYGDKKLIAPGIICGAIGYALGNFLGLGLGLLLSLF